MKRQALLWGLLGAMIAACSSDGDGSSLGTNGVDGGGGTDANADVKADADGNADSDAGSDADEQSDTGQSDTGQSDTGQSDTGTACIPLTCGDTVGVLGEIDDGCGGKITCPTCPSPMTLGTNGVCECNLPNCKILCDGDAYEDFDSIPFSLDGGDSGVVIRNCTFRNANRGAVIIQGATDVLIQDCHFESLRSGQPGIDLHAINIPSKGNRVTIRGNTFVDIGADGVQMGHAGGDIGDIYILDNHFYVTNADVGENGVDVKTTTGPIVVAGNTFHGFRPCDGDTQDCSGAIGEGMVVHKGATGVTVTRNVFYDNTIGLSLGWGTTQQPPVDARVINNFFYDNKTRGLGLNHVHSIEIAHNTFIANGDHHLGITGTPTTGGTCSNVNNLFVGSGTADSDCNAVGNLQLTASEAAFVDVAARNLHLTAASAAVNAGEPLSSVGFDFDGHPRPVGSGPDVGADELE